MGVVAETEATLAGEVEVVVTWQTSVYQELLYRRVSCVCGSFLEQHLCSYHSNFRNGIGCCIRSLAVQQAYRGRGRRRRRRVGRRGRRGRRAVDEAAAQRALVAGSGVAHLRTLRGVHWHYKVWGFVIRGQGPFAVHSCRYRRGVDAGKSSCAARQGGPEPGGVWAVMAVCR